MSNIAIGDSSEQHTTWQQDSDFLRQLVLAAILKNNPIPIAYRLNYVANFYVGPLIKKIEKNTK